VGSGGVKLDDVLPVGVVEDVVVDGVVELVVVGGVVRVVSSPLDPLARGQPAVTRTARSTRATRPGARLGSDRCCGLEPFLFDVMPHSLGPLPHRAKASLFQG
jgi:hypothetical protein